ncbi:phosphoenolpyruvate synthase [Anoxybacillus vitaminiphilus]|uniref:Phosphoenolpyruvate synthase n=1 Tax=Paranoxybacillus vitaminiphilus TaxID=581036 RepID=A0A327Y1I5_9BACL|nr:phenylalanine--tRNA ligase beta subunit-related protein [Anoxybacillus vitaminiphilus]RAK14970.1 phosphoenolpyruvate synthase [Anoxybacillus vitaminiphilus]
MEFSISKHLKETVHHFKVGVIVYNNIIVEPSPQMLKGRLQFFQESLYFDLQETPVANIPEIQEWRTIFKQIGTDPNRYRHSAESLYRRIHKQNFIGSIHSAADLNNFFSLYYKIPIGIYDLDKISGNISIDIGTDNDEYIGINGRVMNFAKKLVSKDDLGPFGSPIVDSERTAVTFDTKNAVQIVYLLPSISNSQCEKIIQSISKMFIQIHGGDAASEIVL